MIYNYKKFSFVGNLADIKIPEDSFVVDIQQKITNQDELYNVYKSSLTLPDYFGDNWNAFWDVLTNLDWVPQKILIIRHYTFPLLLNNELKNYLEILHNTIIHWEKLPEHKVQIYFQEEDKNRVKDLLS